MALPPPRWSTSTGRRSTVWQDAAVRRGLGSPITLSVVVVLLGALAAVTGVMATSAVVFLLVLAAVTAGVALLAERHRGR